MLIDCSDYTVDAKLLKDLFIPVSYLLPKIKRVIFSNPATIILWEDKTKTVVKCGKNDSFDYEKGLAMAIVKKLYGNTGRYMRIFDKYIPVQSEEQSAKDKFMRAADEYIKTLG